MIYLPTYRIFCQYIQWDVDVAVIVYLLNKSGRTINVGRILRRFMLVNQRLTSNYSAFASQDSPVEAKLPIDATTYSKAALSKQCAIENLI